MRFYVLIIALTAFVSAIPTPNADVGCIPKVVDGPDGLEKRCVGFIAAVGKRDE
ncbi:uncharacterized protein RAG0_13010 [Rhynchosporium agropyri]|uniref:Uncharacterized protein n=2 Tax=Rhynchosporium TaxID=38037 RepID=A0A1E1LAT9_9HELO|nr:uncharacterized protein RCO7_02725 [Rhynchosporium commune]CZT07616.1 uncharacterized protein RAG0_13010 [Rhynchosporium agropyri]